VAEVILELGGSNIVFGVPQVYYKSFKNFISAHFKSDLISWQTKAIEDDDDANWINIIARAAS
jgi:hypothetical protein